MGGFNGGLVRLDTTETLDMSNNSYPCQSTEPYVFTIENAVSFVDNDDVPIVCGGSSADGEISDACFSYPVEDGDLVWTPAAVMGKKRRWAAGVRLDEDRYWVTGNYNNAMCFFVETLFSPPFFQAATRGS